MRLQSTTFYLSDQSRYVITTENRVTEISTIVNKHASSAFENDYGLFMVSPTEEDYNPTTHL